MRIVLGVVLLLSYGCASARYVTKGPNEGLVAMPCDNEANRRKAKELMANHFPDGYEIVFEEEAPIGTVTHVHKETRDDGIELASFGQDPESEDYAALKVNLPGMSHRRTDTTYTTEDKTEWRIHYRRKPSYLHTPSGDLPRNATHQKFNPLDTVDTRSDREINR